MATNKIFEENELRGHQIKNRVIRSATNSHLGNFHTLPLFFTFKPLRLTAGAV